MLRLTCATALLAVYASPALAAESYDNCTGYIESLPASISTQGTWCLRKDLATGMASGNAIEVKANNVVIDCNDFKIGGLAAGAGAGAASRPASCQPPRIRRDVPRCLPGSRVRRFSQCAGRGAGGGMLTFAARPEPMIASARISIGAPFENSAVVPTAVQAG